MVTIIVKKTGRERSHDQRREELGDYAQAKAEGDVPNPQSPDLQVVCTRCGERIFTWQGVEIGNGRYLCIPCARLEEK